MTWAKMSLPMCIQASRKLGSLLEPHGEIQIVNTPDLGLTQRQSTPSKQACLNLSDSSDHQSILNSQRFLMSEDSRNVEN
jgi:hypothetical protein